MAGIGDAQALERAAAMIAAAVDGLGEVTEPDGERTRLDELVAGAGDLEAGLLSLARHLRAQATVRWS